MHSLTERLGCFLFIVGGATFALFGIPLWDAFLRDPQTVPMDWMLVLIIAGAAIWAGWKLYRIGSTRMKVAHPPSLGERVWDSWHHEDGGKDPENKQR